MLLIGLTGGVGMGKSTSANILVGRGIPVIDTDVLARQLVEPGQPTLKKIEEVFGKEVISSEGGLQRAVLARKVFADPNALKQLEQIMHPGIREMWKAEVERWRADGLPAGVVVIPLLFETAAASEFEIVLCAACTGKSQRERLAARGWSAEQIEQRISAQWPIERKMLESNYVIWAEGPLAIHTAQIERICEGLRV